MIEPDDAARIVRSLASGLREQAPSARLDAVLCLLEAADRLLAHSRVGSADIDEVLGCLRAAGVSVRSYLWESAPTT
ncbi:hypothetical protein [Nocardia alni]|uniref:hypothetical protein n=1 Tax=Nocardia alni TaxID=2815723 RepID=UPI001C21E60B|nr:hypothetical protein [Nocardia alni]